MGHKWLAGVVVAGFILVTPSVVWSQIAGRVQDGNGVALSGATVEAWDSYPGGSILASGTTNGSGSFNLGAIGPAEFDLRVWRNVPAGPGLLKASHFPTVVRNLPEPISNTTVRLIAVPNFATNPFYCDLSDDGSSYLGELIFPGDVIEALGSDGAVCGVTRTNSAGSWLGRAYGDDPLTAGEDEGPVNGEVLGFRINGIAAVAANAPITFTSAMGSNRFPELVGSTSVSGITLTGPTDATGSAGNSAFIVYQITNSGNVSGNFTLNVELNPGWTVNLSSQKALPLNLSAGETASIVAEIVIPGGTADQDVEVRARISSDAYGEANSGAWTMLSVSTTSDVGGDNGGLLPNSFSLAQNYPNPFNAGTNITYSLDQSGPVTLTVCNLLGQNVRTLFEGHRESGIHTEAWDGRDDHGNAVPSGIYFSRLVQNEHRQVRKMVLLK